MGIRERLCENPAPAHGGKDCTHLGKAEHIVKCATHPPIHIQTARTTRAPVSTGRPVVDVGCDKYGYKKCNHNSKKLQKNHSLSWIKLKNGNATLIFYTISCAVA